MSPASTAASLCCEPISTCSSSVPDKRRCRPDSFNEERKMPEVNLLAVGLAALSAFALGGLWYSLLFAKAWIKLTGQSEEKLRSGKPAILFGGAFLLNLIAAFVLAMFIGPMDI